MQRWNEIQNGWRWDKGPAITSRESFTIQHKPMSRRTGQLTIQNSRLKIQIWYGMWWSCKNYSVQIKCKFPKWIHGDQIELKKTQQIFEGRFQHICNCHQNKWDLFGASKTIRLVTQFQCTEVWKQKPNLLQLLNQCSLIS